MKRANLQTPLQYRFADRPLALAPRAVDAVMSSPRAMFGGDIAPAQRDQGWELTDGGIAILPIFGPLLQRGDEFTRWLGITSYDDIGDAAEQSFADPAGMVGGAAPQRMVPAMAFAGAPRMHGGGWAGLKPNEVPAILQKGERVLSRREVVAGASGAQNITINIQTRDAESFRQSRTQVSADIARAVAMGRRGM